MKSARLLTLLVLVTAAATPGIAAANDRSLANDRPLADAGLDQTTTRGTTVYLDAGGSRDPDGAIAAYEWMIETPGGTTTPDCVDCERTHFRASSVGTYEVTLTVTDDDGATATDTLYVTVEPGAPPEAALAGPSRLTTGEQGAFTADLSAGAAPLDRAIWYVDGERRTTIPLDGNAASLDHDVRFATNGTHEVRIVAVDDDGQRGSAVRAVAVTRQSSTGQSGTNSTGDSRTATPHIEGPQVVTGDGVLRGTYTLSDASSASWVLDDGNVGQGSSTTLTLAPGRHELYAVPSDGGVATFEDGSRTVIADPAPEVSVGRITEESVVTVDAYATDELGNLESVAVIVDGEPLRTTTVSSVERRSGAGKQVAVLERLTSLAPGDHVVAVRAIDSRGQTAVATRRIHVPGPPEVVSAGFVNEGPFSVYHPRLDSSRYTAKYRVKVDLNGVEPERLRAEFNTGEGVISQKVGGKVRSRGPVLVITKKFSRNKPGKIYPRSEVKWRRGPSQIPILNTRAQVRVKKSKPVIRLRLLRSENSRTKARGAVFDASGSFDPDGTSLNYRWRSEGMGGYETGPIGKLNPLDLVRLNVTDAQGQTNLTYELLQWFVPDLRTPKIESPGPYYPNETVTFQVSTVRYELGKSTYEDGIGKDSINLGLRSDAGTVSNHTRFYNELNGGETDKPADKQPGASYSQHQWNVSVPAREFLRSQPGVTIYATKRPQATKTVKLPNPGVYEPLSSHTNVRKLEVEYKTKVPEYSIRETASPVMRDALQKMGFDIYAIRQTGTAYHLEKRIQTQSAEFETRNRTFTSSRYRSLFLGTHPSWEAGGTSTRTKETTKTETVWRNSRTGDGEFTGRTRRQKIDSAKYRTEHEFRYQRTTTYETTETYETTVQRTITTTETRQNCVPSLGCRVYVVTTSETVEFTVERERTVTKQKTLTETYWGVYPRGPNHEPTGDSRTVKVEGADYRTQYLYEIQHTKTETTKLYTATKRAQVQSAQYEWRQYDTVMSERKAKMQTLQRGIRIADTEPTKAWTMRQKTGTRLAWTSNPENRSQVAKTRVEAVVDVETKYLSPENTTKAGTVERTRTMTVEELFDIFISTEEAKKFVLNEVNKSNAGYQ